MAEIQAFRGFRFDLARVGNLSDVVAPPYDVIDPALQQTLYDRSPFNTVRLILNQETPADTVNNNRYSRAAQAMRDWTNDSVVVQDSARCLYVYQQEFEIEGKRYTRKGFMARVRLEPFGTGRIYPHEETMSGPKADRLKLFHATNMNLSQIFGLFPDEAGEVQKAIDTAIVNTLPIQATDHLGVVSRLWPVADQAVINTVSRLMSPKPVFIADGHHRYETALKYLDEKQAVGDVTSTEAPANFVLMMLVSMHDPGLVILPTHRLVSNVGSLTADDLRAVLGNQFELEIVGTGPEAARQTWEWIEADGTQGLLGFGTVTDGTWMTGRFRTPELMAQLAGEHSPAWQSLAVSVLQRVILEKLLPGAGHPEPKCKYVHLLSEVNEAIAAKACQLAVLVPPASMQHVEQIAGNLEKMPPKSTYFYPKLLSGLVFHSLKVN